MKTLQKLIELSDSKEYGKIGNHRFKLFNDTVFFYYYDTSIFTINIDTGRYSVNWGGYFTSSTSRAINYYCRYFGAVFSKNNNKYEGYIGSTEIKEL